MKKILTLTFLLLTLSAASFALTPITGPSTVCLGSTIALSDTTSGGTWSSSNTSIATVGSTTGIVNGVAAGIATITYTLGSSYVTQSVTVAVGPAAITGGTSPICVGSTTTLADATSGGTWTSYGSYYATVGASTGVVTGVHGGTALIVYSIGTGCNASITVTVDAPPTGAITGPSTVCAGSTITLADSTLSTGTTDSWSSSNPLVATIGSSSGIVTGVATGTVTITLTVTSTCGSTSTLHVVTVINTTSAGTIVGPSSVALGGTITLTDPTSSSGTYTWSSANPTIATVGSSSGVVTGVATGTATISYAVTGCGGTAYTSTTVTVTSLDGISGHVLFSGTPPSGNVRVYLVTYDTATHDLEAMDSLTMAASSSVYYQFTGLATDSYRVKAALIDTFTTTTGYIPTYHINHFYWHDADVIHHVSGTSDINEDINMAYGTTTSGPGFVGGSVLTGANKGTSGGVPVVGLRMNIINSTTSQLMGTSKTDASGNYTFHNLPVGQTYHVFPDSMNYLTTPYVSVTLTSTSPSNTSASFIQHTISKTITPVNVKVPVVQSATSIVATFPNPVSNKLNIQWYETANENAAVTISDIAGRTIYSSTLKMTQGAGNSQVDLSSFVNGLYTITIKSDNISYTSKIQVQH